MEFFVVNKIVIEDYLMKWENVYSITLNEKSKVINSTCKMILF